MSSSVKAIMLALSFLMLTGCYHAVVHTGNSPGSQVVEEPWAHSFVYGIVPPSEVDGGEACAGAVARVETQMSFLNGLVSFLTWGMYTPMTITVVCASGDEEQSATAWEVQGATVIRASLHDPQALDRAAAEAVERWTTTAGQVVVELH